MVVVYLVALTDIFVELLDPMSYCVFTGMGVLCSTCISFLVSIAYVVLQIE